mgnify:CR=1 FL=1
MLTSVFRVALIKAAHGLEAPGLKGHALEAMEKRKAANGKLRCSSSSQTNRPQSGKRSQSSEREEARRDRRYVVVVVLSRGSFFLSCTTSVLDGQAEGGVGRARHR